MATVPVWVWLPGDAEPTQAAELQVDGGSRRFIYLPNYLARTNAVALDPVELRLSRRQHGIALRSSDGLPGVIRDAKPAGYGADRLNAQAGVELSPLELLELGVPDAVGAIEVCTDIERKLAWRPKDLEALEVLTERLEVETPASRALRRLTDELETSAGGERPKATLVHDGRLWLAKMQDRGDRPALPAREYVTMRLASEAGLDAARVALHTFGSHQVLLVERFDREGDPIQPRRRLYASAHTVMQLQPATTKGDPQRSYLHLGDRLRVWARDCADLTGQLHELWRRMAFNALVGNVDDHPLNHGLLYQGQRTWHLSPAFDITPAMRAAPVPMADGPALSMATGTDGAGRAGAQRLIAAAGHFGLSADDAQRWLAATAKRVSERWEPMLRDAAGPLFPDAAGMEALVEDTRPAFAYAEWLASNAGQDTRP